VKEELAFIEAPRHDVRRSRTFRRTLPLGMKAWRSMTINFDLIQTIEHVVLECPDYKLTERGPVYDIKEQAE